MGQEESGHGALALCARLPSCAASALRTFPRAFSDWVACCVGAGAMDLKDYRARVNRSLSSKEVIGMPAGATSSGLFPGGGGICALVSEYQCAPQVYAPQRPCEATGPLHTPRTPAPMSLSHCCRADPDGSPDVNTGGHRPVWPCVPGYCFKIRRFRFT